jgi:hypothetical protein
MYRQSGLSGVRAVLSAASRFLIILKLERVIGSLAQPRLLSSILPHYLKKCAQQNHVAFFFLLIDIQGLSGAFCGKIDICLL